MLLEEALNSGAIILTDAEVTSVEDDGSSWQQIVSLKDGRKITGDVVVGADGGTLPQSTERWKN